MKFEKLKTAAPLMLFGALALILIVGLHHSNTHKASKNNQYVGLHAPTTDLPILNGSGAHFMTQSWYGRPYVVNFFASWCPDCKAEHEELMTLSSSNVPIIGIMFKDTGDKVTNYLDRAGNPYIAVAQDDDDRAKNNWEVTEAPETFVIDATGVIRWHYVGTMNDDVVTNELMPVWESVLRDNSK